MAKLSNFLFGIVAKCALLSLPGGALADIYVCDTSAIRVTATTETLARSVCVGAENALRQLGQCSLALKQPVTIQLVEQVVHPFGYDCFAYADCESASIQLSEPTTLAEAVAANEIYSEVPIDQMFEGLIAHELTHLVVNQIIPEGLSRVDHEYMAYVMQMQSYPPQTRQIFLNKIDATQKADPMRINSFFMRARPTLFAAYAWAHFSQAENGCAHFQRLLSGKTTFNYMIY
ncbi:DUF6639 family protein [Thalassovita sp.]|uniref:DUF6639 family protein n=1 Tax=Thalassovita sp. TaxID=1979401 RepID=UPI0029DE7606|nr:DUF6639 family protein [Thalassovita sp.]